MIDPAVLKFFAALLIAALIVEFVSRISRGAAWVLVAVVILGMFLNNPILTGWLNLGSKSLQGALK